MNMASKASIRLLLLFLGFSFVLFSAAAIPATRSLKSGKEIPSSIQDLLVQDAMDLSDSEEQFGVGESFIEGRMDLANTDYPGTGANNHHDPKTPGRA